MTVSDVDIAIVGGSIAGAALAATLAEAGLDVAVTEREPRWRDRVRGEAIHPWGIAEVTKLGLLPVLRDAGGHALPFWRKYRERVGQEPYRWADDTPGGECEWTVFHPALQAALLERAAAAGARVLRPARAVGLIAGDRPELDVRDVTGAHQLRARLLVGADGKHSVVRRWLGISARRDPPHHRIGGGRFAGVTLDPETAHQAYFPGGMVMVFPQGGSVARCYIVCAPEEAARLHGVSAFLERCAAVLPPGNTLAQATAIGPCAFFDTADVWSERLTGPGVVLIGDAAGANDPAQGHGLSLAFRDARELRDLLLADDDWQGAVEEFARRRNQYFAVLRAVAQWGGALLVDQGLAADERRQRVAAAREVDRTAGGFAGIFAFGPDGLVADEAARRHFFGEDLAAESETPDLGLKSQAR